ncbi:Nucleotidyltransferase domain-containing protein [Gracilibacillus ureilyticus]|uniref:Nucleotidyltransferase domain-containing protein n=1 Tax=Gracilibacillus ureilyticus TaxID=531814 RepID=A0A1H9W1L4_9BACI|nr:nucleotidyltransferase domain-containing protein [Gracilibacillus ureilyticus]SES27679.1 Nucleotidyltransferase domain-containing protein [Gracilibacillus ureilyticus]
MRELTAIDAAERFIETFFPTCEAAVLAGSVVRGEATDTSDLDIVIFDKKVESSYRESLIEFGWPIEVFVHNLSSYREFFEMDYRNARPSMQRMIAEGIVLKDEGVLQAIKSEAEEMLKQGPENWTEDTIRLKRYFLTDLLDDFIGSNKRAEEIFIAGELAMKIHEFVLRTNDCWIGSSKWIVRALRQYDHDFAERFADAFDVYYRTEEKSRVIELCDEVLEPYGGRLFDGFSLGKSE